MEDPESHSAARSLFHLQPGQSALRFVVAVCIFLVCARGTTRGADFRPLRKLPRIEQSAADNASRRADVQWSVVLKQMKSDGMITVAGLQRHRNERTPQWVAATTKGAEVKQAYQELINQYPRTEIAAYCVLQLSGVHEQFGEMDESLEVLKQFQSDFDGTYQGMQLQFTIGLHESQARNEYAKAREAFLKVQMPNSADPHFGEAKVLYLSAQEQIVKCELKLGEEHRARDRVISLKKELPEFTDELDQFYGFAQSPKPDNIAKPGTPRRKMWILVSINLGMLAVLLYLRQLRRNRTRH